MGSLTHVTLINPRHDIFTFLFLFSHHSYHKAGLTPDAVQTSWCSQNKGQQLFFFLAYVSFPEETVPIQVYVVEQTIRPVDQYLSLGAIPSVPCSCGAMYSSCMQC